MIRLELPTKKREKEAKLYIKEHLEHKSNINGSGGLFSYDDYNLWLEHKQREHHGEVIRKDHVSASTYFAINEEDKIVGMTNIRHYLSELLIVNGWGHIGYGVRPTERRKGYATEILRLALIECKKLGINEVMVGCLEENKASAKVIAKNGGILSSEFLDKDGLTELIFLIKI